MMLVITDLSFRLLSTGSYYSDVTALLFLAGTGGPLGLIVINYWTEWKSFNLQLSTTVTSSSLPSKTMGKQ